MEPGKTCGQTLERGAYLSSRYLGQGVPETNFIEMEQTRTNTGLRLVWKVVWRGLQGSHSSSVREDCINTKAKTYHTTMHSPLISYRFVHVPADDRPCELLCAPRRAETLTLLLRRSHVP